MCLFLLFWERIESSLLKFKATILFFCLMVYIMELAALPVYCMPIEKAASTCAGKTESSCSSKTAESPCKKPAKEGCSNTSDCCLNCPLCYVMTIAGVAMPGKSSGAVKKEYPHYQSNYIFIYCSTTWKPPNGC